MLFIYGISISLIGIAVILNGITLIRCLKVLSVVSRIILRNSKLIEEEEEIEVNEN